MAREREIHKIDNYLIRLGWVVLVFAGIGAASAVAEGGGVEGPLLWFLVAALLMLVTGYHVRRQENRALTLWDILEHAIEVRVGDLITSTGLSREELRKVLSVVNAQPGAYYVWDVETDTIVDGRLRKRAVQVDRCASCGAGVNATLSLDLAEAPACPYCGGPVSTGEQIMRMREETLEAIRVPARHGKPFSIGIFIVLVLVFWPAALFYALWKGGVLDSVVEKLGLEPQGRV